MSLEYLKNLKRGKKKLLYGVFLFLSDFIFLTASCFLSYYLRFYIPFFHLSKPTYTIDISYIFYSGLFILFNLLVFGIYRMHDWDKIFRGSGHYFKIFKSIVINIVFIIIIGYLFETFSFSRIWIFLLFIFSILFLFLSRFTIGLLTRIIINKLSLLSKTLIIGIGESGRRIEDALQKDPSSNFNIVGYIEKKERIDEDLDYAKSFLVLGYLKNLRKIILKTDTRKVIISSREYRYFEILDVLDALKGLDVLVLMFPGFFEFSIRRMSMREVSGVPLFQISNIGLFGFNKICKNLLDYSLGLLFFIIFIPIYLFVSILIKIDSKGPVLFKQRRYTGDYKEFYIYKFRTMYLDAEDRLKDLKKYSEADGPLFKMKDDPRITRIGKFLRRLSIDEFPQIINVLKGELSLVGPRPPIPEEVGKYKEWQKKRLNVKQGITGLWQVSGRSDLSFEEMVRLDLYYIQNWSIGMDIKILLKTITVVLLGRGAY